VFSDWLDLMLTAYLSFTDNVRRGNTDMTKFDGEYEKRYMEIVERYKADDEKGNRPIDYFAQAFHALYKEIDETGNDCLGEIYMREITYGEHGQCFTAEHVTDMMAQIIYAPSKSEEGRQVVCDPCCGSGRMLSAHKQGSKAFCVGIDLDMRCAKMCALNLLFRGIDGDVYWGDSLRPEMHTVWMIRGGGFIMEEDKPETPERIKHYAEEQKQLPLMMPRKPVCKTCLHSIRDHQFHTSRKRGHCLSCECTKYIPDVKYDKPLNRVIGRMRYKNVS
jgi:hypothetical protein